MTQLTLENIETKICEKCKLGMKCESIIDDEITYFCPACLKEYKYTICLNCYILFISDGYRMCEECRKQSLIIITETDKQLNKELLPAIVKQ
jgi:hypothetical protein